MACGYGLPAQDCATDHWCEKLHGAECKSAGKRREWRADCPVCKASRSLAFGTWGRGIRWWSFCGKHPREALEPVLRELLPDCMPGHGPRRPIDHDELIALLLSGMPAQSLKLAGLEMAGMSTPEALDKLGVRREHRSRVIRDRTRFGAKPQVGTRTNLGAGGRG